ncbi:hypothetical protein PGRAN_15852 [Listeria grandensis FSL F6-0971]|uniref:Uncharacterized protein n=1 Tax=Listeria grandensis FSL F6-0971 TaxID=1265819 RepID=W7AYB0_9LIST|nr:hypothetical protein [Listeria grandensis]EUJ18230.1 hypothetical protein PGRAN_15852 [Listeria grandensis FSL F6-0971]
MKKKSNYKYVRDNKEIISEYLRDLYTLTLLSKRYRKSVRVQVISKTGFLGEAYLKSEIRKKHSHQVIEFCDEKDTYDLVVSDFSVNVEPTCDVLVCHVPLATRDMKQLQDYIQRKQEEYDREA